DQHAVLGAQQILQSLQGSERAFRVLLAVTARKPDAANHLAVDDDRETANESGEASFEAQLDAEGLVAGQGRAIRRGREEMRRALVAGRSKRLVPGDLRPGNARAVHALERDRVAAVVDDANGLAHADLLGLAHGCLRHGERLLELELERRFHSPWYTVL